MVDDDNMRDWAADCNGEGQEWVVRDGGDSGVVMMALAAADNDSEGRQQQWQMATACKIGRRTMKGTDKSGRREMTETWSVGNDGCRGGRWRRWTTTVADNNNGGSSNRQTMTAVNKDSSGG